MNLSTTQVLEYVEKRMLRGFLPADRDNILYFIKIITCASLIAAASATTGGLLTYLVLSPQIHATEQQSSVNCK